MRKAFGPDSCLRPHRHPDPPRWELFVALAGRLALRIFDDAGRVVERTELAAGGPDFGAGGDRRL